MLRLSAFGFRLATLEVILDQNFRGVLILVVRELRPRHLWWALPHLSQTIGFCCAGKVTEPGCFFLLVLPSFRLRAISSVDERMKS